jgi:hypothetical protein
MNVRAKKDIIATMLRAGRRDLANVIARVVTASPADDFAKEIEQTIKKHFPKSGVAARYKEGIARSITVWFTLQGDPSKHSNKIAQNDPAHQIIHVWFDKGKGRDPVDQDDTLPEKFSVDNGSPRLTIRPGPESKLAFDRVKLPWRKKAGNKATILKHIDTYFARTKKIVKDNFDRLPDSFQSKGLGLDK